MLGGTGRRKAAAREEAKPGGSGTGIASAEVAVRRETLELGPSSHVPAWMAHPNRPPPSEEWVTPPPQAEPFYGKKASGRASPAESREIMEREEVRSPTRERPLWLSDPDVEAPDPVEEEVVDPDREARLVVKKLEQLQVIACDLRGCVWEVI